MDFFALPLLTEKARRRYLAAWYVDHLCFPGSSGRPLS